MNNPADVPKLTARSADQILGFLWKSNNDYGGKKVEDALKAVANHVVITKSAAAEEADRARIGAMREALEFYSDQRNWVCRSSDSGSPIDYDSGLRARQALTGASENG